ncbi:F-box/kelch-repeat protein At3g06240-like [Cornus florida]|uniref:F-box/kelch-repeat protein At3g06240-like n=1 Tax=Cornus florida TaxID=4283 RepID=UPI0028A0E1FE|nr:F-box/kelch-repeat protein At3g06240-like [Cornus florida]
MGWVGCWLFGKAGEESRQGNGMKAAESITSMPYIPHHLLVEALHSSPSPCRNTIKIACQVSDTIYDSDVCLYTVDIGSAHNKDIVAVKIDNILDIRPDELLYMIGSCNGLVCIWFSFRRSYVIFNPSTRESNQIPDCDLLRFEDYRRCGFGYDSSSDDYKLVKLGRCSVCIYSLRGGSWKKVQDYVGYNFFVEYIFYVHTQLNGAIHWFCLDENSNRQSKVVAFDLVAEKLSEIPLPSFFTNVHETCHMGVFGGCLCVKPPRSDEFWVMKEYVVEQSWTKFHAKIPFPRYGKPLALLKNYETLYEEPFPLGYTTLVTSERTYRDLVLHGLPNEVIFEAKCMRRPLYHPVLLNEEPISRINESFQKLLRFFFAKSLLL